MRDPRRPKDISLILGTLNSLVKANAGTVTNFEVLDLLNSKGASKDTTRVMGLKDKVSSSEYKVSLLLPLSNLLWPPYTRVSEVDVYDYLMETAASTQTRESVTKFSDKCKDFKLVKAEILNIINLRPSSDVELTPIIEKPDEREIDTEGILELVQQLLPPLPTLESEQEETENAEQEETAFSRVPKDNTIPTLPKAKKKRTRESPTVMDMKTEKQHLFFF
ncbi:hypothetical protein YC2023_079738 [Brassica napus]